MSNRYLSSGVTSELAKEDTLVQIKNSINNGIIVIDGDTTIKDVDTGGTQTNPLEVDIVNVNKNNADSNIGNASAGTLRVVIASDQPAIPVTGGGGIQESNVSQINGNTIDSNTGNSGVGTQRVVIASDQPEVLVAVNNFPLAQNVNLESIDGVVPALGVGGISNACLRVCLPTDQPAVQIYSNDIISTNVSQISGAVTEVLQGSTTGGTQRICLANDQQYNASASLPIQIKNNYIYSFQKGAWIVSAPTDANNEIIMDQNFLPFRNIITGVINPNLILPLAAQELFIVSTSVLDTAGGLGLQSVVVSYYTTQALNSLTSVTINLNGTTPVSIALDIFRIDNIIGLLAGATGANAGIITVTGAGGVGNYPGGMRILTNRWQSGHIYIPNTFGTTESDSTITRNTAIIDKVFFQIDNNGGSDESVRIYFKQIIGGLWTLGNLFQVNTNSNFTIDTSRGVIDGTFFFGMDLMLCYLKTAGAGSFNCSWSMGGHIE